MQGKKIWAVRPPEEFRDSCAVVPRFHRKRRRFLLHQEGAGPGVEPSHIAKHPPHLIFPGQGPFGRGGLRTGVRYAKGTLVRCTVHIFARQIEMLFGVP